MKTKEQQQTLRHACRQKLLANEGLGTLEMVLIIAVLLAVAFLFREQLSRFAKALMEKVFDHSLLDELS